ncbi:hypothetical protein SARC_15795 [Sphaeroforma arctica JP610]|uniref:Uncharacterized protein n=1 Tax=Sphaeroforma arctica JP610 TaxID=667725 RepID=A0A0L0F510_9EUKA|nr:hypothetical protein SARC_15795 [Sphaeroforma arctica JP610]KNC71666.1 hypothetical protein SARC_15795 [Sphaeroforma arctica JP610]|eukprot:XP_014145568.1 hypothetical protein SARC_15795 [Sphaeroforma arctica JP610]
METSHNRLRIGADELRLQIEMDQSKFYDTSQSVADIDLFQMVVDGPLGEHYLSTQFILRQFLAETGQGERINGAAVTNPSGLEQVDIQVVYDLIGGYK